MEEGSRPASPLPCPRWAGSPSMSAAAREQRRGSPAAGSPRLWGGRWRLIPEAASADETLGETGEAFATLRCGGSAPFNEGCSEVVFSEGRTREELCFLMAASRTHRAPEGASHSTLGPAANRTKCFLVSANGEARSAAAAAGAWCQDPRGSPGVCQVSGSASETWPPSPCVRPAAGAEPCPPTTGR